MAISLELLCREQLGTMFVSEQPLLHQQTLQQVIHLDTFRKFFFKTKEFSLEKDDIPFINNFIYTQIIPYHDLVFLIVFETNYLILTFTIAMFKTLIICSPCREVGQAIHLTLTDPHLQLLSDSIGGVVSENANVQVSCCGHTWVFPMLAPS